MLVAELQPTLAKFEDLSDFRLNKPNKKASFSNHDKLEKLIEERGSIKRLHKRVRSIVNTRIGSSDPV